jgi:transcriptional regulator with XRE-family HTH domain
MTRNLTKSQAVKIAAVRRAAKDGSARRARVAAELSLRDIAGPCGVAASTVMRWEAGRAPNAAAALRYAAILADLEKVLQAQMDQTGYTSRL